MTEKTDKKTETMPKSNVVIIGNFAERRKNDAYRKALEQILKRAEKLDW